MHSPDTGAQGTLSQMADEWNPRQTALAVLVAAVIGIIGGGAISAATDHGSGPGGFGPPGSPPRSASE